MIVKHTLSFDSGELSPWLDSRTDIAKYAAGSRLLENFIPLPQGGLTKRPGMEFLGQIKNTATTGILIDFQISSNHAAILSFGGGEMRVWVDGAMIKTGATPYSVAIPWADADLAKVRSEQINDVMYLVHVAYPMQRLTHKADNDWVLEAVDTGENAPLLHENTKERWTIETVFASIATVAWASGVAYVVGQQVTYASKTWRCTYAHTSRLTPTSYAPGATTAIWEEKVGMFDLTYKNPIWVETISDTSSLVGQDVTLKASVDTWTADHVGSTWEISKKRTSDTYEVMLSADNAAATSYSKTIIVKGGWTFETLGTWYGTFSVERSIDRGVTWEEIRKYTSTKDVTINSSSEGNEATRVLLRIKWVWTKNGSSSPYARLTAVDSKIRGTVRIKSYTSPTQVIATTLSPVEAGITSFWSEGAWSKVQGYPSCVETHQGRLVVAATKALPHSIWGSAVDDYPNFYVGTDADMAYWHTIPVGERDPILWLISEKALLIGTGSNEFVMTGENEDTAITPEFGTARRQSSYGSNEGGVAAIFSDSVALFIQRGGTRVREFAYRFDEDRYAAANLNILADHLFDGNPITSAAVQRMPFQIVWFVAGGKLYGLTYERAQQVAAWHRHETQGTVISVAVIRTATNEDEVWFLVNRGTAALQVERFRPGSIINPQDDGWWMDAAVKISAPYNVSTAAHLAGKDVIGYVGGYFYGPTTLAGSAWPFVSVLQISGMLVTDSDDGVNPIFASGYYVPRGLRNGRYFYEAYHILKQGWYLQWVTPSDADPRWILYRNNLPIFESTENVSDPADVTTWTDISADGGELVVSGLVVSPGDPIGMLVSSSPEAGLYTKFGTSGGKPLYYRTDYYATIYWNTDGGHPDRWEIQGYTNTNRWYGVGNVATPNLCTAWLPIAPATGVPAVTAQAPIPTGDLILGLPFSSVIQPMKPEIPMQNGSSRSREMRIHRVVPSLYKSRGGKIGENPDGRLDPLDAGNVTSLFTGEKERELDSGHNTEGNVCIVSDEPYPFALRSIAIKFNVYGDAS